MKRSVLAPAEFEKLDRLLFGASDPATRTSPLEMLPDNRLRASASGWLPLSLPADTTMMTPAEVARCTAVSRRPLAGEPPS